MKSRIQAHPILADEKGNVCECNLSSCNPAGIVQNVRMAGLLTYPSSLAPSQFVAEPVADCENSLLHSDCDTHRQRSGNYSSGYCWGLTPHSLFMPLQRLLARRQGNQIGGKGNAFFSNRANRSQRKSCLIVRKCGILLCVRTQFLIYITYLPVFHISSQFYCMPMRKSL